MNSGWLQQVLPEVEAVAPERGDAFAWVPAARIVELCRDLSDRHGFDCCSCITGTDRGDHFEVVYHLFSYPKRETIVLKVRADRADPAVPSVAAVWPAADWMERETFDLLGIRFEGHPNLKRILLPEDWAGHPLRKDYQEPAEYAGMTTTRP